MLHQIVQHGTGVGLGVLQHAYVYHALLFRGTGYLESSNSDYRRIVNLKKLCMYLIPQEMRAENGMRLEEQMVSSHSLICNTSRKQHSTGVSCGHTKASDFTMYLTDYAKRKSHEDIYPSSRHWHFRCHSVSAEAARNDTGEHERTLLFALYKDDSPVPGMGSRTMQLSDVRVISLHMQHD